jgi:hypothetical protein
MAGPEKGCLAWRLARVRLILLRPALSADE